MLGGHVENRGRRCRGAERMLETTRSSIVGNFDILFHKHKKDKINLWILMISLFRSKEIFKCFFMGEGSLFVGTLCGLSCGLS